MKNPHPTPLPEGEGTNPKYSDNLILYRTNAQSRAIEDALRKKNIKYKIYGTKEAEAKKCNK